LRRSWLSREVVVMGAFGALASAWAVSAALHHPVTQLGIGTVLAGLAGVYCSVMVYVDTRRDFWRLNLTLPKFAGSVLVLGAAALVAVAPALDLPAAVTHGELRFQRDQATALDEAILTPLQCSARLLNGKLGVAARSRLVLLLLAGLVLPVFWIANPALTGLPVLIGGLCAGSEFLERYLYFTAVAPPKMPGGL
jgi:DMSO reductase anchor subunit